MEKKYIISAENGLHARPATQLVNIASKFSCDITLEYKGRKVNFKSIMGVMSLGVPQGGEITIEANGTDANEALQTLEDEMKKQDLI
ncbi:MAG TPA: phosphocarrier protein HPr [Haloplasmataceae bacterium]